ncbi:hypothetical protein OVA14_01185 [Agrococcus sp. SL85]|nr:hypothetical protein OVA14_01185 [Agrococcus sp. SL85]
MRLTQARGAGGRTPRGLPHAARARPPRDDRRPARRGASAASPRAPTRLAGRAVEVAGQRLEHLRGTLRALSPQSTLDRGYAVVQTTSGHVLRDAAEASPGDRVLVTLAAGSLAADVQEAHPVE